MKNYSDKHFFLHTVLLCGLVALNSWGYVNSVLVLDSSRDLSKALDIVKFNQWPTLGPDIGGFFHLGPFWYYFLAIPTVFGSLPIVAIFVGCVSGLKFIMAYVLGKELVNREFGLLWAVALLLPGWHTINQVFINHVNVLEVLTLLSVWLLIKFVRTERPLFYFAFALVLGLGLNAHPSFLVMTPGVLYLSVAKRSVIKWWWILTALLIITIPFIPYIINQTYSGFPDLDRYLSRTDVSDQLRASGALVKESVWLHWLGNVKSMLVDGPFRIVDFVGKTFPEIKPHYLAFYGLFLLLGVFGLAKCIVKNTHRSWVVLIMLLVLMGSLIMTLLRSFTPFYFTLTLSVLILGMLAYGVYEVFKSHKVWLKSTMIGLCLFGLLPVLAIKETGQNDQIYFGPIMNINAKVKNNWMEESQSMDALRISQSKELGKYFCDQTSVVNGPMAALIDVSGALPVNFYCKDYKLILGGPANLSQRPVLLLSKYFWSKLGAEPDFWITDSWGAVSNHKNHHPEAGMTPSVFDDYVHPPRSNYKTEEVKTKTISVETQNHEFLVVSNLLPYNVGYRVEGVAVKDKSTELKVVNMANHLYHCADCKNDDVIWTITITANDLNAIDINTF